MTENAKQSLDLVEAQAEAITLQSLLEVSGLDATNSNYQIASEVFDKMKIDTPEAANERKMVAEINKKLAELLGGKEKRDILLDEIRHEQDQFESNLDRFPGLMISKLATYMEGLTKVRLRPQYKGLDSEVWGNIATRAFCVNRITYLLGSTENLK